jgi:hypothetical protein
MPFSQVLNFDVLTKALDETALLGGSTGSSAGTVAPEDILKLLARLRMLDGVPFNTLVPDSKLLPNESIRFFFLDRAWTDALVQGALSVGTANTIERAQLERLYPEIEAEIDQAERRVRSPGGEPALEGTAGIVTGFLLRSAAVAGWPGLHVRAYKDEPGASDLEIHPESHPSRIKLLRLERLAPAVLLALFDGVPQVLHIEEPRQGVQFGVKLEAMGGGRMRATVPARNVKSAKYVNNAGDDPDGLLPDQAQQIPVRFRRGAPGVLDLTNTGRNFLNAAGTHMSDDDRVDGAEFAMQMIRFPFRQVFAQSATGTLAQDDAFKPTLAPVVKGYTQLLKTKISED